MRHVADRTHRASTGGVVMVTPDVLQQVRFCFLILYVLRGGADYGGGSMDLSPLESVRRTRALIAHASGQFGKLSRLAHSRRRRVVHGIFRDLRRSCIPAVLR